MSTDTATTTARGERLRRVLGRVPAAVPADVPGVRDAALQGPRPAAAVQDPGRRSRRGGAGVPAREILLGGGNINCITQQVPRPAGAA